MTPKTTRTPRPMPPATSGLAPQPQPVSLTGGNSSANAANSANDATPANKPTPPVKKSGRANGTTRSWYLPHEVANDLSAAAEALYFDLRGSREKSEILGVLIRVGLNNMARVRKQLGLPPAPVAEEAS
jgi:hypothetical protein